MEQNKIRTYILYAVGEIILVVIGILIALQVNNWNEERKRDQQKKAYFIQIQNEMINDLEESIAITQSIQNKYASIEQVLKGELTRDDYLRNTNLRRLIRYTVPPFSMNRDGYLSLMEIIDEQGIEDEQFLIQLKNLYEDRYDQISQVSKVYSDAVLNYRAELNEKYSWYHTLDPVVNDFTESEIDFLLNDPFYKNEVYTYWEYANLTMTLLLEMQIQKAELIRSIGEISGYLPQNELVDAFNESPPESVYTPYLGRYKLKNSDSILFSLLEENDTLKIQQTGGESFQLVQGSSKGFQIKGRITQFAIENDSTLRLFGGTGNRYIKINEE